VERNYTAGALPARFGCHQSSESVVFCAVAGIEKLDIIGAAGAIIGRSSFERLEDVRCFREKAEGKDPAVSAAGFFIGSLHANAEGNLELFLPWHEPQPLSKAACKRGWRSTEKLFSGSGFAATRSAGRYFGFACAAIAGNGTARLSAAAKCGADSSARPTGVISKASRGGWIIATVRSGIAAAVTQKA
jgi:hypothetical protein